MFVGPVHFRSVITEGLLLIFQNKHKVVEINDVWSGAQKGSLSPTTGPSLPSCLRLVFCYILVHSQLFFNQMSFCLRERIRDKVDLKISYKKKFIFYVFHVFNIPMSNSLKEFSL